MTGIVVLCVLVMAAAIAGLFACGRLQRRLVLVRGELVQARADLKMEPNAAIELAAVKAERDVARRERDEACSAVDEARAAYDEACAAVDAARREASQYERSLYAEKDAARRDVSAAQARANAAEERAAALCVAFDERAAAMDSAAVRAWLLDRVEHVRGQLRDAVRLEALAPGSSAHFGVNPRQGYIRACEGALAELREELERWPAEAAQVKAAHSCLLPAETQKPAVETVYCYNCGRDVPRSEASSAFGPFAGDVHFNDLPARLPGKSFGVQAWICNKCRYGNVLDSPPFIEPEAT